MTEQHPHWIAELPIIIVHPDGRRVSGHIAVGHPYVVGGGDVAAPYESHCRVEIDSLWSSGQPLVGGGTLQALLIAVRFLGTILHRFIESGGRVLDAEDGSDVHLVSLFGPMLREFRGPDADGTL